MATERFKKWLLALVALLGVTVLPMAAEEDAGTAPYSIELTHNGGAYKVRFTIEGADSIKAAGQGTGADYAQLEGHAAPSGNITVTMEWVACNGDAQELEFKSIDVLMGNQARNGDAERSDDELQFTKTSRTYDNSLDKVVYTFNCADFQKADPSVTDSTLMVTAYSTVQLGSNVTETHLFLKLKLDGLSLHHTEDNNAKDEGGSERYIIPIVIGGVLVGGEEWLRRTLKKRKKKNENDNENEEGEEDEEDDIPDMLEMELYKDFGDTLVTGDAPKRVSACIVRHPKDGGPEYVDKRLTQMIQIFADDGYTAVEEEGVINGWKCALVQAPDWETPPEEGIVQFRVASPEASYTNRIHFKIQKGQVVFGQDNLTLPAMYDKEIRLPFLVTGIKPTDGAEITATVSGKRLKMNDQKAKEENWGKEDFAIDYTVDVEWSKQNNYWEAVIRDIWQDEKENEQYQPGDFLEYNLAVEAKTKQGLVIKGKLPLYRFYMGLAFQMEGNNVGCYLEEYDPVHHIDSLLVQKQDDKEVTPAETRCWLRYYTWDENTNHMVIINPALQEDRMTDTEDGKRLDRAFQVIAYDKNQQERVNKLGLQLVVKYNSKGEPYYILRCRFGVLNAPNRIFGYIQCRCILGGKECVATRPVLLLSQPKPSFRSPAELAQWQKKNNQTRDRLEEIDREIYQLGLYDRLAPLVNYLHLHLDAYEQNSRYGFDERCVKAIMRTYHHVLEGEQQETNSHALVACDSLEEEVWEYFKCMRTTIDDMGTWQKLFISVATLGLFDVATGTIEVIGAMKDYVDKGGDSVFGAFFVGVKIVTAKYLMEKAMNVGMSAAKNYLKSGGDVRMTWKATKVDAKKMLAEELNSVKVFGKKLQAAETAKVANKTAQQKADEIAEAAKNRPRVNPEKYKDDVMTYGRKRAQQNLQDLQDAVDICKANPTEANILKRNQMIIKCQKDKQTMMILKGQKNFETIDAANLGVNFGECRKAVNTHLDKVYKATDNRMKHYLSKEVPGLKPEDIKILGATSSDKMKLLSGKSITFDRDVTYFYIDKVTGKKVYFPQKATEKLYAREFYQVAQGGATANFNPLKDPVGGVLKNFSKEMDQTIVEDVLKHPESYGVDLDRMIKAALHGEKLKDPTKVAEAVFYKGKERFVTAAKIMKEAQRAGSAVEKLDLEATAIGEMIEGCRQQVKVFKLLDSRNIARMTVNGESRIPNSLREGIAVLEKLAVDGSITFSQASDSLARMGQNFETIFVGMYRAVGDIG